MYVLVLAWVIEMCACFSVWQNCVRFLAYVVEMLHVLVGVVEMCM